MGVNICAFPVYLLYGAAGVVLYAYYHDCDPISTGRVQRPEQVQHTVELYNAMQCNAILCNAMQYNAMQRNAV